MHDPDRFRMVNSQCERVCHLINRAERTADVAEAKALYRLARILTQDISDSVRDCLAPMIVAYTALDDAA